MLIHLTARTPELEAYCYKENNELNIIAVPDTFEIKINATKLAYALTHGLNVTIEGEINGNAHSIYVETDDANVKFYQAKDQDMLPYTFLGSEILAAVSFA